jgi:hypothetical protein
MQYLAEIVKYIIKVAKCIYTTVTYGQI